MNESTHRSFSADPDYVGINFVMGTFQVLDTDGDTLEVRFGDRAQSHLTPACVDYLHAMLNDDEAVDFHHWQLEALHTALSKCLISHAERHQLVEEVAA